MGALTFDPDLHEYRVDGVVWPSVTQVLAEVGVSEDFEAMMQISRRVRDSVEDRRLLGSIVHADLWAMDDDDIDMATVSMSSAPYLRAWEECRQHLGFVPLTRERRVYHPDGFCGTYDGVYRYPHESPFHHAMVDFKIGSAERSGARWQLAAYVAAYLHENPTARIDDRLAIELRPNLAVPYRVVSYGANWRRDYRTFQCFLATYRHQAGRRHD